MRLEKKIEIALRKQLNRYLQTGDKPLFIEKTENVFRLGQGSRVLLLRQDRIGDLLVSVPIVRAIRDEYPDIILDILLGPKNISAKKAVEKYVDSVISYDKRPEKAPMMVNSLRVKKYDLVVDMFDNFSTTSTALLKFIGAKNSLGLEKENSAAYSHIVPLPDKSSVHIVERLASLLGALGIDPQFPDLSLEYDFSEEELTAASEKIGKKVEKILGINLSGSTDAKFWGLKKNISFIEEAKRMHPELRIVIFATPDKSQLVKAIIDSAPAESAPQAASFHEYAALLACCDIIMTPDTAAVHIAAARKIPCIAMYDVSNIEKAGMPWTPYNSPYVALRAEGSIVGISVNEALDALEKIY